MHRRYNDIAIDLDSSARDIANELESAAPGPVMPVPAPPPAPNAFWLLVAIAAVFVCCYVFMYWLVAPMFVLKAVVSPLSTTEPADLPAGHVLIFGPPGSGKSTALARQPAMRVFDVATRAWVERRKRAVPVPRERRLVVLGAAVGEFRHAWRESYGRDSVEHEAPAPPTAAAPAGGGWADSFDYAKLPGSIAIDHADYRLEERELASQTLTFVERAVYRDGGTVRIVSDRDLLACLRESGAPAPEVDRWVRALRSFRRVVVSVPASYRETPQSDASAAAPYYESLWNACSIDERLALRQLAEEGLVNPQNQAVVRNLMRTGLIVRDPAVRIMNDAFREFVLQAVSAEQISAWESRGVGVPWGSIEVALLTGIVVLAGLLLVTQEQLLNAWVGFIPVLLPVAKPTAETVWKLFSAMRPSPKDAVVG
jgi:hypothetical protein